jgi:Tfp pilus assembly protein PilO
MNRQFWIVVGSMAAGLVLMAWLGWQFLLRPVGEATEAMQATLAQKKDDLEKVKGAEAQYDKFKRDADSTRHEVQLLRQRLDPDLTEGELVRMINGEAQALNPRDLTWSYSPRVPTKLDGQSGLDEVPFKLSFKSDYETVGKLVNAMVSQLRLISPERVNLTNFSDQAEGRVTVSAVLEFKMFLESNGSTPAKVGN